MSLEQNTYLGQEKLGKLLLSFSLPCVFSLLVSALYNIVDQIFIGNSELGYLGNAATGVVFPLIMLAMAFAWCVGDGSAAYLSLCQGRATTKAPTNVWAAASPSSLLGVLLAASCLFWQGLSAAVRRFRRHPAHGPGILYHSPPGSFPLYMLPT